ncbi:polyprenyl diphosphate synthase [Acetobacter oeni]|uniref:Isoprenyl transferase n=1 Tax=Acetobacter oeni TaxID=304077 RepID=A0A511XGB6_9PROT|nr:polyprenyl diphosphate synthase [Acetobacter oeni]MBB3882097.1 undecaprenyl diphosphate synthase [Acetobacter oeni]NHO17861.1 di-trans,poly-cis-decaprenylcistransferase [Acetobacter oeni]GBR03324.1 undecaprenyl pyrophosphate synthetase [Acetobacter oeni LMG 21952]GEN61979.1 isoprenyl transferase [Acetobacter oeni]
MPPLAGVAQTGALPAGPSLTGPVPKHVAIIMDGNGRWAASRGLPRAAGHKAGAEAVTRCLRAARANGVDYLTLYAFSSENWRREPSEVADLTGLLRFYLRHKVAELHREKVKIRFVGEVGRFGQDLCAEMARAEALTEGNSGLTLLLALSYGGRSDIVHAARALAQAVQCGDLAPDAITEDMLARYLLTAGVPDPDVIVRTSGEHRLSNFLLWQSAYAELVFLETLWPDFDEDCFTRVLNIYGRRERRFGARPA